MEMVCRLAYIYICSIETLCLTPMDNQWMYLFAKYYSHFVCIIFFGINSEECDCIHKK